MQISVADALEIIMQQGHADKVKLDKAEKGMYKLSLTAYVTSSEAHHVIDVLDAMEDVQKPIPNMIGG